MNKETTRVEASSSSAPTTSLKKSLRQIGAASASLGTTAATGGSAAIPFSGGGAFRLLAQEGGGFDAAKWVRSTRELQQVFQSNEKQQSQQQTVLDQAEPAYSDDLDVYRRQTLQHITQTAIRQAMQVAEESSYNVLQRQLKEDYEQEKKRALTNLMGYHPSAESTHNLVAPTYIPHTLIPQQNGELQQRAMLPDSARHHAAIIQRWNDNTRQQPHILVDDLHALANDLIRKEAHTSNATKYIAYANAFALLQTIVSGYNSNIAMGCLEHLCQHYQNVITGKVKEAITTRRIAPSSLSSSSFAQFVHLYVQHFVLFDTPNNNNVIWAQLYYCLRCGNVSAALETLQQQDLTVQTLVEPEVIEMLTQLGTADQPTNTDINGKKSSVLCVMNSISEGTVPSLLRKKISDLFQRVKHRSTITATQQPDFSISKYKIATLQLLATTFSTSANVISDQNDANNSVSNAITDNPVVLTIEDYLFTYLWIVLSAPSPSYLNSRDQKELANLGKLLKHWGPAYFEPKNSPTSGGWSYAMPLILAQQFQTALTHLANSGGDGLLQATHLAAALFYSDVPLEDLSFSTTALLSERSQQQEGGDSSLFFSSILVSYSKTLQQSNPEIALEYLVLIPSPTVAKQEIQRLLLDTQALDILSQALSRHFSESQKKSIFDEASRNITNCSLKAELLDLAGNYGALLQLFIEQLCAHFLATESNGDRKFWYDVAVKFHDENFSSPVKSKVIHALESEGALDIGKTFQLALNLMVFFDKYMSGEWQHAIQIVYSLPLLPTHNTEISQRVELFNQGLDWSIRNAMSSILLATTEALYQQYLILKEQRNADKRYSSIDQQQVGLLRTQSQELHQKVRTLVTFSGLIHLSSNVPDLKARIGRMEACMI